MKAVVQRVSRAGVEVDGREVARIGRGLLALVGVAATDDAKDAEALADKLVNLRIFEDPGGKMNLAVRDVSGGVLLVPNFTVAGDARKGRRPSFDAAMAPAQAEAFFARFVELVRAAAGAATPVEVGVFRAHMLVTLVNDGPVTILLDTRA